MRADRSVKSGLSLKPVTDFGRGQIQDAPWMTNC
jgi:hypothetical protein